MANPICPTDCTQPLADVLFEDCAPNINPSEIQKIFLTKVDEVPFTDWKSPTEWTTRISAAGTTAGAIRELIVIGDKPAAAGVSKDISGNRKFIIGKDHSVNFSVDDVSDENYEFMRSTECGGIYKMWYETKGGFMFGGNEGIRVSISMDSVLNRGADEIEMLTGVATWRSKFSPERVVSPIFAGVI